MREGDSIIFARLLLRKQGLDRITKGLNYIAKGLHCIAKGLDCIAIGLYDSIKAFYDAIEALLPEQNPCENDTDAFSYGAGVAVWNACALSP